MKTNEEINKAKSVPIVAVLASRNITNPKIKGSELVFNSPFRNDSTPSFSVDTTKNIWLDFGQSSHKDFTGGSVIDLIMQLEKVSFPVAVDRLLAFDCSTVEINKYQLHHEKQRKLELLAVNDFTDTPQQTKLYNYAFERGIDGNILENYCKEIIYKNKGNQNIYSAIGFKNNTDGFELRYQNHTKDNGFKGCLGRKEISTINDIKFVNSCYVFEGFFDFLSFCQYFQNQKTNTPLSNIIVLNTLAIANRVDYKRFKTVYCYFDNDTGGLSAYNKLSALHTGVNFINASAKLFPNHNDFNDFILWQNQKRPTD